MKIGIVGGGTSGLITALILKQDNPKFQIDIIELRRLVLLVWVKDLQNIGLLSCIIAISILQR